MALVNEVKRNSIDAVNTAPSKPKSLDEQWQNFREENPGAALVYDSGKGLLEFVAMRNAPHVAHAIGSVPLPNTWNPTVSRGVRAGQKVLRGLGNAGEAMFTGSELPHIIDPRAGRLIGKVARYAPRLAQGLAFGKELGVTMPLMIPYGLTGAFMAAMPGFEAAHYLWNHRPKDSQDWIASKIGMENPQLMIDDDEEANYNRAAIAEANAMRQAQLDYLDSPAPLNRPNSQARNFMAKENNNRYWDEVYNSFQPLKSNPDMDMFAKINMAGWRALDTQNYYNVYSPIAYDKSTSAGFGDSNQFYDNMRLGKAQLDEAFERARAEEGYSDMNEVDPNEENYDAITQLQAATRPRNFTYQDYPDELLR